MKTTIEPLTKQETLTLARKAYDALSQAFYSKTTNYAERMLAECRAEEKSHRGFMDGFSRCHPNAASVSDCAKLFVVKRVADYLNGEEMPKGKDYLHFQKSAFTAAGIADEYGDEVRAAWKAFDLRKLASLDYCVVVN